MASRQQRQIVPLRLDVEHGLVWQGAQRLRLTPKAYAVLAYLLNRHGQVVEKGLLLDTFWPDPEEASEAALTTCIREIRKKLDDKATVPCYIETVYATRQTYPGSRHKAGGYRFVGLIEPGLSSAAEKPQGFKESVQEGQICPLPSPLVPPPGILDRAMEFEQLCHYLQEAWTGKRQMLFLTGEPGIGKTTLVEAFVGQLRDQPGLWIGRGQCVKQYGEGEAYLPILDAFGRLGREVDNDQLVKVLDRYAPTWLTQMPALVEPQKMEELLRRTQGATQQRILREITEALEVLTETRTLLLWLEDLHWSDISTLQLLAWLALRPGRARLLILGTFRPVEIERPLASIVQELHIKGGCQEIPLQPLTAAAVTSYLTTRFPTAPQAALVRLASAVYQRTEGNSLFMVNVVNYLDAQGWPLQSTNPQSAYELERLLGEVPKNLSQMIEIQIACFPQEEQRLLETASVVGTKFSTGAVAAGSELEIETVEECCAKLAQRGHFLRENGMVQWPDNTITTSYHFLHTLYQEVLYQRLSGRRRIALHRRIGKWQEHAYSGSTEDIAAELAVHFTQGREFHQALSYRQQAANTAMRRSAYQEAIAHLTSALKVLQELADHNERLPQELVLHTLLGSALMATQGYAAAEVHAAYAQAQNLCSQVPESPQLFPVLFGLWGFHLVRGKLRMAHDLGEQLLRLARGSQEPELLVESHGVMGVTLFFLGELVSARAYLEQSLTLYDPQKHGSLAVLYGQDPWIACRAYLGQTLWLLGYPDQALHEGYAGLAYARELSHPFSLAFALFGVTIIHLFRHEGQAAQKQAEASLALCSEQGFPFWEAESLFLWGWALAEQGQHDAGLAQMSQGLAAQRTIGSELGLPMFLASLAHASAGQMSAAFPLLTEALMVVENNGERRFEAELYRLQAHVMLQQFPVPSTALHGAPRGSITHPLPRQVEAEAEACLLRAIEIAQRQHAKSLELRAAMDLSRLWQQQGKRAEAHQLLAEIYHWFTAGFDTGDLQEAKVLLDLLT